ncbi:MAG: YraN family protein [Dissulfurispiraceae bacterium]|jgi:putative endonuclease|nr:YraN family protein [Dissulfurispiraceae bacterium]
MRKLLGINGEEKAAEFLKSKGYTILHRNYKVKFGEADIIAKHGEYLVFIEVKTRKGDLFGQPYEAVDTKKQQKLRSIALAFMKNAGYEMPVRFDIISIVASEASEKISHMEGAF